MKVRPSSHAKVAEAKKRHEKHLGLPEGALSFSDFLQIMSERHIEYLRATPSPVANNGKGEE